MAAPETTHAMVAQVHGHAKKLKMSEGRDPRPQVGGCSWRSEDQGETRDQIHWPFARVNAGDRAGEQQGGVRSTTYSRPASCTRTRGSTGLGNHPTATPCHRATHGRFQAKSQWSCPGRDRDDVEQASHGGQRFNTLRSCGSPSPGRCHVSAQPGGGDLLGTTAGRCSSALTPSLGRPHNHVDRVRVVHAFRHCQSAARVVRNPR